MLDVIVLAVPVVSPGKLADQDRCAALAHEQESEGGPAHNAAVEAAARPRTIVLLFADEIFAALAIPVAIGHETLAGQSARAFDAVNVVITVLTHIETEFPRLCQPI